MIMRDVCIQRSIFFPGNDAQNHTCIAQSKTKDGDAVNLVFKGKLAVTAATHLMAGSCINARATLKDKNDYVIETFQFGQSSKKALKSRIIKYLQVKYPEHLFNVLCSPFNPFDK